MESTTVEPATFPALTKTSSGIANNLLTVVTSISFSDKLLITVTQAGKLAHWVHVPLATASLDPLNPTSNSSFANADPENALLPRSDLTATTVLGGTKREDEVIGQTLCTTVASAILMKRPGEERLLVMGLGLQDATSIARQGFGEIVGLILDCL
ncbi:hypothetical protein BAUCODRAFT_467782 [Baudoinia panamericana UAMH 10762]|uniref:Uncharacterized protein n=1 Tax=Baudoinia panamericana (strain UAMH 10762) TaxID=717646 RepID=M2NAS9_BAUPA|nr:uncharacterized protein BAUCODRAFT_467782 [Baudoinia panamericana UAMH 10762]EMC96249.1 hypothetical protein BAUCODRAFT_467782 [Baudoinia panamericana UAMH 10762]